MKVLRFSIAAIFLTMYHSVEAQIATTPSAPPSGGNISIQGQIYLPNGRPIERSVRIDVRGPRAFIQTLDSDNDGRFSFRATSPGSYSVYVDAGEEFEPATESILIDDDLARAIQISPLERSSLISVYLKPRRTVVIPAATVNTKIAAAPNKAVDAYEKGRKLAGANKLQEAVTEFRKATQIFPAFFHAFLELGNSHFKLSQYNEAVSAFEAAVALDPANYAARLNLGMSLMKLRRFVDAEGQFVAAADADKHAVAPHYYVGVIRFEDNRTDDALAAFEKANELNGDKPHPLLHKYLAAIYLKKNRWDRALVELETYLAQSPAAEDAEKIRVTISELKSKLK